MAVEVCSPQEAVADEEVGADEVGVSGEGGEGVVGIGPVGGWGEGEELPPRLFGTRESVEEVVGRGAEVADAVFTREGGEVQEEAGGAGLGGRWGFTR